MWIKRRPSCLATTQASSLKQADSTIQAPVRSYTTTAPFPGLTTGSVGRRNKPSFPFPARRSA
jgi:hypothetical protein